MGERDMSKEALAGWLHMGSRPRIDVLTLGAGFFDLGPWNAPTLLIA
jgi:hypothetical protein